MVACYLRRWGGDKADDKPLRAASHPAATRSGIAERLGTGAKALEVKRR